MALWLAAGGARSAQPRHSEARPANTSSITLDELMVRLPGWMTSIILHYHIVQPHHLCSGAA